MFIIKGILLPLLLFNPSKIQTKGNPTVQARLTQFSNNCEMNSAPRLLTLTFDLRFTAKLIVKFNFFSLLLSFFAWFPLTSFTTSSNHQENAWQFPKEDLVVCDKFTWRRFNQPQKEKKKHSLECGILWYKLSNKHFLTGLM